MILIRCYYMSSFIQLISNNFIIFKFYYLLFYLISCRVFSSKVPRLPPDLKPVVFLGQS